MSEFILSNFDEMASPWQQIYEQSQQNLLFSSPSWLKIWWDHFGSGGELCLASVREGEETLGIAPLQIREGSVRFIGSDDVCDFIDFPVKQGKEQAFFNAVLDHLAARGLTSLHLSTLLPDSATLQFLPQQARQKGFSVSVEKVDVNVDMELPGDVSAYLNRLSAKQRHEILRKERRLNEEGEIKYSFSNELTDANLEIFLRFFRESREDKNRFLTDKIELYFRALVSAASKMGMLRLGIVQLNTIPVATTLCFAYKNDIYLYNSGYHPDYRWLSVGILSKFFCVKHCIEAGVRRFDFLKGDEKYKYHMGGREVPLYKCTIRM